MEAQRLRAPKACTLFLIPWINFFDSHITNSFEGLYCFGLAQIQWGGFLKESNGAEDHVCGGLLELKSMAIDGMPGSFCSADGQNQLCEERRFIVIDICGRFVIFFFFQDPLKFIDNTPKSIDMEWT